MTCNECHDTGTIDDPLSSAAGGRWFRYCSCHAGKAAAAEEYQRRFPKGVCAHSIDRRDPCVDCLTAKIASLEAQVARVRELLEEWERLSKIDSVAGWYLAVSLKLRAALYGEKP